MLWSHLKTRVGCFVSPISPFLPFVRVQYRGSRKGFSHSWLVAYNSNILPRSALAELAGETVHNPALNPTHPVSDMPEFFTERWTSKHEPSQLDNDQGNTSRRRALGSA